MAAQSDGLLKRPQRQTGIYSLGAFGTSTTAVSRRPPRWPNNNRLATAPERPSSLDRCKVSPIYHTKLAAVECA